MASYEDLAPCACYGSECACSLKAVGWLTAGAEFTRGKVSAEFFRKLCELSQDPWQPQSLPVSAGVHHCELCRFTGGGTATYKNLPVPSVSNRELFVPGEGVLYCAPVNVAHYVDAHAYQPPDEFCRAVLACPPMRSKEHLKAILDNGGRELVRVLSTKRG